MKLQHNVCCAVSMTHICHQVQRAICSIHQVAVSRRSRSVVQGGRKK